MLLEQLAATFGPLPADVTVTVQGGSESDLKTWGSRFLTAATLADIVR